MKSTRLTLLALILSFFLLFSLTPLADAETAPLSLKDFFLTTYPSAKVMAENDDYLMLSADYDEIQQASDAADSIVPDGETFVVTYKAVIVFLMRGDTPLVCAYVPVNDDGTLVSGGDALDPNTSSTVLISPAFLIQNMNLAPTAP